MASSAPFVISDDEEEPNAPAPAAAAASAPTAVEAPVPLLAHPTGLANVGNTCYMNAVLQCLASCQDLREYFMSGAYAKELNFTNPLGSKGEIALGFSKVVERWANPETPIIIPKDLKRALERKKAEFRGFQQHDAHELLECLLDGLHEDVNRVHSKPYRADDEGSELPLAERAAAAWDYHIARNNSQIADLFHGQYLSTLTCPECAHSSTRFDPFTSISLPLPPVTRRLQVQYVRPDADVMLAVLVPEAGEIRDLRRALAETLEVKGNRLRIAEVFQSKFQRIFSDSFPIAKVLESDVLVAFYFEFEADATVVPLLSLVRRQCSDGVCNTCNKVGPARRCARCLSTAYCCGECQVKHWPQHKAKCRLPEAVPGGTPTFVAIPNTATYKIAAKKCVQTLRPSLPASYTFNGLRHVNNFGHLTNTPDLAPFAADPALALPVDRLGCLAVEWLATDPGPAPAPAPVVAADLAAAAEAPSSAAAVSAATDPASSPAAPGAAAAAVASAAASEPGSPMLFSPQPTSTCAPVPLASPVPSSPTAAAATAGAGSSGGAARPVIEHASLTAAVADTGTRGLHGAFAKFCTPEQLSADNTWYCSKCKSHTEATKQMMLFRAPRYLLIHLRRFSWRHVLLSAKLNTLVDFPLEGLDISPYFAPQATACTSPYSLIGVVQHYGTLSGGHYTAAVRLNSTWHKCDDDIVRPLPDTEIASASAYILVYKRD